ncbi:MAG: choice-of-anchor J domain-containing protein, partial [Candidatus Hydrothermales bacterium]
VCPIYHVPPYTKNFDESWLNSTEPPFCGWSIVDGGDEPSPAVNTNDWHRFVSTAPARTVARVYFSPREWHDDWLISPRFNCSAWGTYKLSFWHYYNDYSTTVLDSGRVLISTDGGNTWITLMKFSNADDSGRKTIDISHIVNNKDNVKIAFHYVAYDEWYWYIDDFSLSFVPDQQAPNISIILKPQNAYRGPFIVKALINDNASGVLSDTLYYIVNDQVYVAPRISVSGDTFTYQIPDLPAGTVVDYYIRAKDRALNIASTRIMTFCVLEPFSAGLTAYGVPGENNVKLKWSLPYDDLSHYSYPRYVWSGWSQGDMIATRFTPQYHPYKIEAVAMLFYQYQDTVELLVWRDNGLGYPGVLIYSDTVEISTLYPYYQFIDLSSQNVIITSGDFHVGIKWLGDDKPYIVSDDTSFTQRSKINTGTGFVPAGYDFVIASYVSYLPPLVSSSKEGVEIIHEDVIISLNTSGAPFAKLKKSLIENRDSYKKSNLYLDLFGIQHFEILKSQTSGGPYTSLGTTTQTYFVDQDV